MEDNDAQLQLAKRARRRLVGAVVFVSIVAVVLPLLMDDEPRQAMQDVEIRIPGQDETPFAPRIAAEPVAAPKATAQPALQPNSQPNPQPASQPAAQPAAVKAPERPAAAKPSAAVAKPAEKAPEKPAEKPAAKPDEARRAAAILAGQTGGEPPRASGEYLVLIGAFSNEANVANLKAKLGEQGIKVITEPLETPQGRKTRVRAGPFASREAAEKALARMKKIGVSGDIAPRQ